MINKVSEEALKIVNLDKKEVSRYESDFDYMWCTQIYDHITYSIC